MYLAYAYSYCSGSILKDTIVLLTKLLNHTIQDFLLAVAKLAVIGMEADSHLFAFHFLVGHARVVRVDDKINVHQTIDKFPVIQKACDHCSIHNVLALHYTLLLVNIWGCLHHNVHQDSSDLDEGHIFLVLYTRMYKHVWDIYYCDAPLFLGIDDT
jgi:hypothetical protein